MHKKKARKSKNSKLIFNVLSKTSNKRIKLQLETLKSAIEQGKPHTHLQNAEMTYLQNIEPEIDELEEEVEIGEPGIANTQSELYKKYGLDTEESRKLSHIIQDREQIRNIFKVTENQNQNGESNVTDDDTTSTILNEDNKSTSELGKINETDDVFEESTDSKNKKSGTKGKNRKSKKRDTDTMSMLSSNYALLKEALDNIIDDQANYNIIPENASEKLSMKSKDFSIDNKTKQAGNNKKDKLSIASKTNPSSAQDPEKSKNGSKATNSGKTKMSPVVSHEIQSATPLTTSTVKPPTPPATSSKIAFAKTSVIPEIKKDSPETSPANPKSRPASQKSDHLTLRSRKHSIYSQDGQSDYEYCEDTKQIQMPIQFDNIFSESRQSPYKGLLSETAKSVAVAKPETSGDHTKSELPTPAKDNSPACDNSQTEKTVVLDPKDIHSPTE